MTILKNVTISNNFCDVNGDKKYQMVMNNDKF